jgi:ribonucleoside-diphosphate reductase alpha chain
MGTIENSIPGIFRALQEGALTMQQGGGIGVDFSTLRTRGTPAKGAGNIASGAVSIMHIWDAMCGTILSTGARRGAILRTMPWNATVAGRMEDREPLKRVDVERLVQALGQEVAQSAIAG